MTFMAAKYDGDRGEELNKHHCFRSNPIVLNYVPCYTFMFIK